MLMKLDEQMLMKLDTVVVSNLRMCMKDGLPSLKNIKGDN